MITSWTKGTYSMDAVSARRQGLSTLKTIVADFGDNLSPKTATVAQFGDCRQNRRLIRQQSTVLATVAELATIVASVDRPFGDSRRFWRQLPNSATVAGFGNSRRIGRL